MEGLEFGVKSCTNEDTKRMRKHIPPEFRKFLTGKCSVETSKNHGSGAYQGYEVVNIVYEFNKEGQQVKVFPCLINKYSDKLKELVQVSAIIYYDS